MIIILKGEEVAEYHRLKNEYYHFSQLKSMLENLTSIVELGFMATKQEISDALDALTQRADEATQKILDTVGAETEEDVQQNAALAAKQTEVDALKAEIVTLQEQLAAGLTGTDAVEIAGKIQTLTQKMETLEAGIKTTPA